MHINIRRSKCDKFLACKYWTKNNSIIKLNLSGWKLDLLQGFSFWKKRRISKSYMKKEPVLEEGLLESSQIKIAWKRLYKKIKINSRILRKTE